MAKHMVVGVIPVLEKPLLKESLLTTCQFGRLWGADDIPGLTQSFTEGAVMGRICSVADPWSNLIVSTQKIDLNVGWKIVQSRFRGIGHGWGWLVHGKNVTSIENSGFQTQEVLDVLVRTNLENYQTNPSNVRIEHVGLQDLKRIIATRMKTHRLSPEVAEARSRIFFSARERIRVFAFLAFVPEHTNPVGLGFMSIPRPGVAMFCGHGTLPGFERRGVFSNLVSHELSVAASLGCCAVTSYARANSSPILQKLGFEKLSDAQLIGPEVER